MGPRFLPLLALLGSCAAPTLGVQPRYGTFALSGAAGASSSGTSGRADVEEAGLEDASALAGRVDLELGSPHLVVLAQVPHFEGRGVLDEPVSSGGTTIPAGTTVDARLDLDQLDLALVFDLVPGDTVEVGLGLGVSYFDLALEFRGDVLGTPRTVESEEQVPVPVVAALVSVWLGPAQLGLFLGAMEYEYQDDSVRFVDADLYLRWKLLGGDELLRTSLLIGYRHTSLAVQYDDGDASIDADLALDGVFAGLELFL